MKLKRFLVIVGMLLLLVGCSDKEVALTEVSIGKAPGYVKSFIQSIHEEGANLYYGKQSEMYIYLTSGDVEEGNEAAYFTNVSVEVEGDVLTFTYDKAYTDDLENTDIKYETLHKTKAAADTYDTVRVIENGEETHFFRVGGQ